MIALLGRPGDPVLDVTIRWPDEDEREAVRLGTIVITGVETNEASEEPVFNPAILAEGIGQPPDEMFAARRAAYAISQTRRRRPDLKLKKSGGQARRITPRCPAHRTSRDATRLG